MRAFTTPHWSRRTIFFVLALCVGAASADRRFRYTDVCQYRDGRWRVIAAHDYLVPERR